MCPVVVYVASADVRADDDAPTGEWVTVRARRWYALGPSEAVLDSVLWSTSGLPGMRKRAPPSLETRSSQRSEIELACELTLY